MVNQWCSPPNRLRSSSPHPQAEQQLGALGAKELAQARQPGDEDWWKHHDYIMMIIHDYSSDQVTDVCL